MQSGNIYKIIHTQSNIIYVGSTFDSLRNRFHNHKHDNRTTIGKYMEQYGSDQFKIILIKQYQVVDRKHLQAFEQLWINRLKSINKMQTFTPLHKQFEALRLSQLNRTEYMKQYKKQYHLTNRDQVNEQNRNRYQKNRDHLNKQILCECGKYYSAQHKNRHLKSEQHLILIGKSTKIIKDPTDKILCICGKRYSRSNKNVHLKSKGHLAQLSSV